MKKQRTTYQFRQGILSAAVAVLTLLSGMLSAQGLLRDAGAPPLTRDQQHYLTYVTDNEINRELMFVTVDTEVLKSESFTFNPTPELRRFVQKEDRGSNKFGMRSWCGKMAGYGPGNGDVNMVINGNEVVGHFTVDSKIYALTPLGEGMHVFYRVMSEEAEPEDCFNPDKVKKANDPKDVVEPPKLLHEDILNQEQNSRSSGDCEVRVLIGFTNAARLQFTSILAELNNQINLANTAYNTANVGFNIELAMAYQVNYTESGELGDDLAAWRGTSDGDMDEVHTNRNLWKADQCALIVTGGGGLANLNTDFDKQFSVTGTSNFGVFTFHHELGHNMLCTHDLINTDEPGTAPYAGWGNPNGCFRTILAYPAACGGTGGCPRVNIFSRSVTTYSCGGTNYVIGGSNNRNRDRLVLSRNTVINHYNSLNNQVYSGDYTFGTQEAVHMAANNTAGYNSSSNGFELQNGSQGSFRAADYVTLGEGFWARQGTDFTAYIDFCPPVGQTPSEDYDGAPLASEDDSPEGYDAMPAPAEAGTGVTLTVIPNPFRDQAVMVAEVGRECMGSAVLYDMLGKPVAQVFGPQMLTPGTVQFQIPVQSLPAGIYILHLQAGDERIVQRIVRQN